MMRAPSLRRRVVTSGLATLTVALVVVNAFVHLMMRDGLHEALDELLDARANIASNLADGLSPQSLASRLESLGVPAEVRTADGEIIMAEPGTVRSGGTPPVAATSVQPPIERREVALPDGGSVTVLATRAGVEATLERLLLLQAVGSLVTLVAAGALLAWVVARTMRPIDSVVTTAKRIAEGHTDQRLQPDRTDTELGRLAAALDEMIGAQERALAEAHHAEELSRTFLADASHQLRTPLSGIRACAELLLRNPDPAERDELLTRIVRETARSGRLLSSLLRVARLDQGEEPVRAPIDVLGLVRGEVERAQSLSPDLEIVLNEVEPLPPRVAVDGLAVIEAIANLLDNARRHAESTVEITVSARRRALEIEFRDDGLGVSEADVERIFHRFVTIGDHSGSGLGLPVARGVARAHGGDVTYRRGAFLLWLPIPLEPPPEAGDLRLTAH